MNLSQNMLINVTIKKERKERKFCEEKNEKFKGWTFGIVCETSQNQLSPLPKKTINNFLT